MCEFTQDSWKMYRYTLEEWVFIVRTYGTLRLWPPRLPDLTPPDYFLWGYLKGRVYQNKPWTTAALKANITKEIQAVTADVLARTFQNIVRRVQSCLDANGGHFQHTLRCRHISHTTNVLLFKFRCNIFNGVRIIKEMLGLVASGTSYITVVESVYSAVRTDSLYTVDCV
jgi:hypothetical protein